MFNIGIGELILIFGAIFLFFGPEALPQIAKKAGQILAEFKKNIEELKSDIDKKV